MAAKCRKQDKIALTAGYLAAKRDGIASLNAIAARGQWLEDTHIDNIQALLSILHPAVDGLKSTALSEASNCQLTP